MRLARLWHSVLDFCYPGVCANCESFIDTGHSILCRSCNTDLQTLAIAPACPLCAMPAASDGAPCAYCKSAGVAHYDRVIRLGVF